MIRDGSKTFYTASLLLPQRVCDASRSLYGFCRVADDLVDGSAGQPRRRGPCCSAASTASIAASPTTSRPTAPLPMWRSRFAIPREIPEALIEGFAWDATGRRYQTIDDLHAYAVRVAGTVGAMMSLVMQVRDPSAIARACDLGVAMQLTNIARDVGEDARNARLYLPRDWLAEEGSTPKPSSRSRSPPPALGSSPQAPARRGRPLYAQSLAGIAMLPGACRPSIHAARLLYAEIGRAVEGGHDSVTRRAVVSTARKLALLGAATRRLAASRPRLHRRPPLPAGAIPRRRRRPGAGQPIHPPRTFDERASGSPTLHPAGEAAPMSSGRHRLHRDGTGRGPRAGLWLLGIVEAEAGQEEVARTHRQDGIRLTPAAAS